MPIQCCGLIEIENQVMGPDQVKDPVAGEVFFCHAQVKFPNADQGPPGIKIAEKGGFFLHFVQGQDNSSTTSPWSFIPPRGNSFPN